MHTAAGAEATLTFWELALIGGLPAAVTAIGLILQNRNNLSVEKLKLTLDDRKRLDERRNRLSDEWRSSRLEAHRDALAALESLETHVRQEMYNLRKYYQSARPSEDFRWTPRPDSADRLLRARASVELFGSERSTLALRAAADIVQQAYRSLYTESAFAVVGIERTQSEVERRVNDVEALLSSFTGPREEYRLSAKDDIGTME